MYIIVKDKVWDLLNYNPHSGQKTIHESLARHRTAACGRRFGKSIVGGKELVPEAARTYAMMADLLERGLQNIFWLVGPDYSDGEKEFRGLYNDMKKMKFPFDKPGTYNDPHGGNMHISLFGGLFQVHVKSARYPESLDGEGLAGVELVEAAKLKPSVMGKYIRPALSDRRGWSLATSTPEGKNWFYKRWQMGQDPAFKTHASWRMPAWINTKIFPGGRNDPEILDMKQEMSEELFKQEVEADFSEFVGRVFKSFDEEIHVKDLKYNADRPVFLATDYGWTNPFVGLVIQVDVFNNVYVLAERRHTHTDIEDIAKDLMTWRSGLAASATRLYPDPEAPGDSAVLAKRLHLQVMGDTGGVLKWRLELIRRQLKLDEESEGHPEETRLPKLFIDRSCHDLIWEMGEGYRYPETREESQHSNKEEPIDKDNHGPEALGRFFRGYFGPPPSPEEERRVRVTKARVRG